MLGIVSSRRCRLALQRVGVVKTSQAFVSRTSDMSSFPSGRSFLQAALDAISRAGLAPVDMRYFPAQEVAPASYCQRRGREGDVYVAVAGLRYGSLVPDQNVSYTEAEFDEATLAGRPRLVFLLRDNAELPAEMQDADRAAIDGFRQRLRQAGLIVSEFTSADGLNLPSFKH